MTLTPDGRKYHAMYESRVEHGYEDGEAVDAAYAACTSTLKAHRLETANDDRAEELIAAIMRYVVESKAEQGE